MCLALSPAWPAGINSVPVVESFESYSNGFDIVGALGWSTPIGGAEVSTNADIVNALTNYTGAGGTFPWIQHTTKCSRVMAC